MDILAIVSPKDFVEVKVTDRDGVLLCCEKGCETRGRGKLEAGLEGMVDGG